MTTTQESVEQQVEKKESVVLHLELLKVIRDAQNQHGLKHSDFHRYRTYCTRRLRRLRRSLKQSASGRSKGMYLKKVINQVVVDACATKKDPIRYLLIPLFSAERAWSYAMALKQEANTESRKKFHLIRKFKKSLVYSSNLEALCNDEPNQCDIRSKVESQAYNAFLHGMFYFEIEQWTKASEYLKKSQAIYSKLIDTLDETENKEIYLQRIDELKPTLRYCAFNLNEKDAKDMIKNINSDEIHDEFLAKKLDELLSLERERNSSQITEINWLGKTIPIKNDKIRMFVLDIDEHIEGDNVKINKLEKKLFESKDCLQFLKENNQEKTALYCYLSYARQRLSCRRALELIKNLKNPMDLIRPYEIIISSLSEINSLPLSQYFSNATEIKNLLEDNESQITAYKAFRCYQIGRSQRLEWKESIALLHRCNQYIETCLKNKKLDKVLKDQLVNLQTTADLDQFNILANNLIKDELKETTTKDTKQSKSTKLPMSERLDEYDNEFTPKDKLVQFPPKYSSIPCKPLFFDLAYYELKFPSLDEETNANRQNASGLSKLVKGFWSWK